VLKKFWHDMVATSPAPFFPFPGEYWRAWNGLMTGLLLGNRGLFFPAYSNWTAVADMFRFHMPPYRTDNAERTLAHAFGEYDGEEPLLAVGLTDVETGEGVLFDSASRRITAKLLANCISIPIIFPPAEIDGRYYWDFEVRSDTLLPGVCELLRKKMQAGLTANKILIIVVDMFHLNAGHPPSSTMESHYRLINILFGEKLRRDVAALEAADAHLKTLERLHRLAAGEDTSSPLAAAVREEYRKVREQQRTRVEFLHIGRSLFPYEYISRDFDYSPQYLERLATQGFDNASNALRAYQKAASLENRVGSAALIPSEPKLRLAESRP
jgi:predicted acylesterase/phospholipase RssA